MKNYTYRIIIEPDGKYYHAYVPALSGCHTFGKTIAEAKKHAREAIEIYVRSLIEHNELVPQDNSFESFETIEIGPGNRIYAQTSSCSSKENDPSPLAARF